MAHRPEAATLLYDSKALARDIASVFAEYRQLDPDQKRMLLLRALKEVTVSHETEILKIRLFGWSGKLG